MKNCTSIKKSKKVVYIACDDNNCDGTAVKVKSSWELIDGQIKAAWEKYHFVAGSGDLDQCNGMMGKDGQYRYYATDDFPYNLGCYHGVVSDEDKQLNHINAPGWSDHESNEQNQNQNQGQNMQRSSSNQNNMPPPRRSPPPHGNRPPPPPNSDY